MINLSKSVRSAVFSAVALGIIGATAGVVSAQAAEDTDFVGYSCENLIELYTENAYGDELGFDHTTFVADEEASSIPVTFDTSSENCVYDFGALYSEGHPNTNSEASFCNAAEFYDI